MKTIKIKTPAKINLTLEVLNKREDGFHNIQSIMQTISLYDYLSFKIEDSNGIQIILNVNSSEIPYNEKNLVYKATIKFLEVAQINDVKINIFIEKNIPVAAGLAGGSTNAAGTFYALNKLFDNVLSNNQIEELCASMGSDLNFCLNGGCMLCTSRGEVTQRLPFFEQSVSLVKPKNIGISAKEAYTKFAQLENKTIPDNTSKLVKLLNEEMFDKSLIYNNLENALFPSYKELSEIKTKVKGSLMSGSGSTFFVLEPKLGVEFNNSLYDIFENLKTISTGVEEVL